MFGPCMHLPLGRCLQNRSSRQMCVLNSCLLSEIPEYRRHQGPGIDHNPVRKGLARNHKIPATTPEKSRIPIIVVSIRQLFAQCQSCCRCWTLYPYTWIPRGGESANTNTEKRRLPPLHMTLVPLTLQVYEIHKAPCTTSHIEFNIDLS
jgi:hypothetical protein